jgi:hypothetical protein
MLENTMHRSLIALTLLLLAPIASAQIYKWTDASGTVQYSETPPAQGVKYKEVKTIGSAQPVDAPAAAATAAGNSAASANSAKPMADSSPNSSKLCETLRANITALQGTGPVVLQQTDGKATSLDDDQRKQQASSAQAQYQQYCQS